MSKPRNFTMFFSGAAFALAVVLLVQLADAVPRRYSPYRKLEVFSRVLTHIENNYVEHVVGPNLVYAAIKGMMTSLDPHSVFLTPEQYRMLKDQTQGEFGGIGVEVEVRDGWLTVVAPLDGSPAHKAGLKTGDQLRAVNGKSTKGMNIHQAVKVMRGPRGTRVRLTIKRPGEDKPIKVTILRDIIKVASVESRTLQPGIGYVRIKSFQDGTAQQMKQALKELGKKDKLKGLVLDLRGNPGGLFDQGVQVADMFVKEGLIVRTTGQQGRVLDEERAHTLGTYDDFPLICLVNSGSASASEIVAGALQDHRRAVIMGNRTFGKGSVQTIIDLLDGSGLKLTVARYYTPSGRSIQEKGIEPDVVVSELAPPERKTKPRREKDLARHLPGSEPRTPAKPTQKTKPTRLKDFQLQTALDYLRAAALFQGQQAS